ncbi:MAG TPA: aconitate hydratase AcnA [Aggregatilineales bacterium]|nr:aconitate hydratase AcnA [Aggregatilineales bacterium]
MGKILDSFKARGTFETGQGPATIYRLSALEKQGIGHIAQLPFSIKILLENALRNLDNFQVNEEAVRNLASWNAKAPQQVEVPFKPARVILQDFTGVACVVDLAALRSAMVRMGGDARKINPIVPVDLVIDHSVQVDSFALRDSLRVNAEFEFKRNQERYEFLHWGQKAFNNFKVVPPATGIVHQVNLEYLAKVVQLLPDDEGRTVLYPDTLVGTDSHTTMINGIGVLGWGVGGIEAEAAMLGQPVYMLMPEVIGFKLTGQLREGATATDLVLVVTQMLRKKGVVDKFVEFYGSGLSKLTLPDRATIANMAPEYGATMGFFPVDDEAIQFLLRTGRDAALASMVERYCKEQGLFRTDSTPDPIFTDMLELDLSTVEPSMAGPKRPQDRVLLREMKTSFEKALRTPIKERGFELAEEKVGNTATVRDNGHSAEIGHGAVVIAAITSCTNTSNPSVMIGAGLLAKKAVERGLTRKPYVKTSLAPGSRVVTEYLNNAGLTPYLEELGFHTVGYGCTTCIGNSGPLPEQVSNAVQEGDLVAAAVLSGNRNFEGRINPFVKANYLASPPLVVAYALAGTVDIDLNTEPIGYDKQGQPVMLKEIWPSQQEIVDTVQTSLSADLFKQQYGNVYTGNEMWNAIPSTDEPVYLWNDASTYIQEPPFFIDMPLETPQIQPVKGARVLGLFGDSITTDHISPAGDIAVKSPAGQFLINKGVERADFNTYGTRRGNDRIMTRGTFANIRLRNQIIPGSEGGVTEYLPTGEQMSIYDASVKYIADGTPLVIFAGADYGMGSSRDWAAKGTYLLGVKAVIAKSFERIHRSNLVMMGVLPLQFKAGEGWDILGLTGREAIEIVGLDENLQPMQELTVKATAADGSVKTFTVEARINTPVELEYYRNGGILHTVLRNFLKH